MKYSSRFFLYAPLALFLILAAGVMVHWWIVAKALDQKLTALNGHEAVPGITVSYATKTISGFPFNIDVVFTGLKIAGAGAHGPFVWSSENFALHRLTYGRSQDIYEAAGHQSLNWVSGGGTKFGIAFLPGSLRASAITGKNGLARFDVDIAAMGGTENNGKTFAVGRLQFHLRRDPDGHDLDLMARADDVRIGDAKLQEHIDSAQIYADLTQLAAIEPLLRGEKPWPDTAAAWRAQGGSVKADAQKTVVQPANAISDAQNGGPALFNPLY